MTATETKPTLKEEIIEICDKYIEKYESAEANFNEEAKESGILFAMERDGRRVAEAIEPYIMASEIRKHIQTGVAEPDRILERRDDLRKMFEGARTARSTNPIANEIENIRHEARTAMIFNRWDGLFSEIEDAIKDRKEEQ